MFLCICICIRICICIIPAYNRWINQHDNAPVDKARKPMSSPDPDKPSTAVLQIAAAAIDLKP